MRLTVSRYYTPSGRSIQKSYEEGVEAYQREKSERLSKGELTSADSIHASDTVKYFTMNKRVVYGGGGIMPDVFVPIDTTQSSEYFGQLVRKGVLNTFALAYVDEHRAELAAAYTAPDVFNTKFLVTDELRKALQVAAKADGIEPDPVGQIRSEELIDLRLKALIARDLWNTSAYWQVINAGNPVDRSFQRALESLNNDTFQKLGMAKY